MYPCQSKLLYLENKCLQPGIERYRILSIICNINKRDIIVVFSEKSLTEATNVPGIQVNGRIAAIPEIPRFASAADIPIATGGSPS